MAMGNVDPADRGFLGDLAPSVLPVYQYRDREQLLNTIKQAVATASNALTIQYSQVNFFQKRAHLLPGPRMTPSQTVCY
ncbi:hypothetical protein N7489_008482 [Penicillium chrysogenum]|uniref:uncharacterized protein n=1 Tax=Penicillium chrysogenum TaxID=5076 RepID=UPI002384A27B|nr:uncharacterized protein N7489_008482 [Penicillium chrysogenum]KAJ5227774.1 hypothetical protein N7489_008482 [Penicillium chrysogenum]KAJ5286499.1 hypothetical protein N7524_001805 [Penicillium chrysogenum]